MDTVTHGGTGDCTADGDSLVVGVYGDDVHSGWLLYHAGTVVGKAVVCYPAVSCCSSFRYTGMMADLESTVWAGTAHTRAILLVALWLLVLVLWGV